MNQKHTHIHPSPALPSDTSCAQAKSLVNGPLDQENIIEVLDDLDNAESCLQTKALRLMEISGADSCSLPRDMLASRPSPGTFISIPVPALLGGSAEAIRLNQGIFRETPIQCDLRGGNSHALPGLG